MDKDKKVTYIKLLQSYKLFGYNYIKSIDWQSINLINSELPNDLDLLERYVQNCNLCTLGNYNSKRIFGTGNRNSDIYIVGANRYKAVPNIGTLFEELILEILNIKIKDIYCLDILKCDNTNSKINLEKSKEICIEFFKKQIILSNVKIVVVLGDNFKDIMKINENIYDISGSCYRFLDTIFIPLIDFEVVYKNPKYKTKLIEDLKRIKYIIGENK